jgi:hypothetical protein
MGNHERRPRQAWVEDLTRPTPRPPRPLFTPCSGNFSGTSGSAMTVHPCGQATCAIKKEIVVAHRRKKLRIRSIRPDLLSCDMSEGS